MPTLYINACIRETSRTDRVARALLENIGTPVEEIFLPDEDLKPLDGRSLEKRTALIETGDYCDPMFRYAKSFARADKIVIAAPYWDLSFPALLKTYLENIYVTGIVSEYGSDGRPHGLCRAEKLYYVTTAGGPYLPAFSYDYIRELATVYFGIPQTELIFAELLDIDGSDPERIIQKTIREMLQERGADYRG